MSLSSLSNWPAFCVACGLWACGPTVPKGGVVASPTASQKPAARLRADAAPTDLIPGDLELVVRIAFSRIRTSLGDDAAKELLEKALTEAGIDGPQRSALARAEVIWLGLRLADLTAGDHVMVVRSLRRGPTDGPAPLPAPAPGWIEAESALAGFKRFSNPALAASDRGIVLRSDERGATAAIYQRDDRLTVFVSPVQVRSVERVLRAGPDPQRSQPAARGLVSVQYRARRLSPELENKFPSLAGLLSGIRQISGVMDVSGDLLELNGRMQCRSPQAALRLLTFVRTILDASASKYPLLSTLEVRRAEATVSLKWALPAESLRPLFRAKAAPSGG